MSVPGARTAEQWESPVPGVGVCREGLSGQAAWELGWCPERDMEGGEREKLRTGEAGRLIRESANFSLRFLSCLWGITFLVTFWLQAGF